MNMFKQPLCINSEEAEKIFSTGTTNEKCDALVSITFFIKDWKWVQTVCLRFLKEKDPIISGLAATCLGNTAKIHHKLDKNLVVKSLNEKLNTDISGQVQG